MSDYQPYIMIGIGLVSSGIAAWLLKTGKRAIHILQELREILTPNGGGSIADKVNALIEVSDVAIADRARNAAWFENVDIRLRTLEVALLEMKHSDEQVRRDLHDREKVQE